MNNFCGTCHHHTFKGTDNWCRRWFKVIPREKWDIEKDGKKVCSCGAWVDWMTKETKR